MALSRKNNPTLAENFDPRNPHHKEFLLQTKNNFKNNLNDLSVIDWSAFLPVLVTGAYWLSDSVSFLACLSICTAAYMGNRSMRPKAERAYQESLRALLDTYQWCAKFGVEITTDEHFLEITKLLVPYVKINDLLVWQDVNPAALSTDYKKILTDGNHKIPANGRPESRSIRNFWGMYAQNNANVSEAAPTENQEVDLKQEIKNAASRVQKATRYQLYGLKSELPKENNEPGVFAPVVSYLRMKHS